MRRPAGIVPDALEGRSEAVLALEAAANPTLQRRARTPPSISVLTQGGRDRRFPVFPADCPETLAALILGQADARQPAKQLPFRIRWRQIDVQEIGQGSSETVRIHPRGKPARHLLIGDVSRRIVRDLREECIGIPQCPLPLATLCSVSGPWNGMHLKADRRVAVPRPCT
ncbi:hypothetical protein [Azospirillum picis]|uniref:Uncharacterized protein n=1 Tax=Azospirillum picis TaxID=488438 RepID=A0ABU0MRD7_9PROT|nr:hypothetical protein [Azospirillum picis]MBP2302469.1 hypothetical protein [Azospirillum picis]MDQ0536048.1 hypothetical protein [Azospirillum picis]